LADDEKAIDDCPEGTGRLIWHGTATVTWSVYKKAVDCGSHELDIVAIDHVVGQCPVNLLCDEVVDGLDVMDHDNDAAGEYQQERNDTEGADNVQTNESDWRSRRGISAQL
jgi:hypothetical protein